MSATQAQNNFGSIFDSALRNEIVVITKHSAPRAVLLSYEKFHELSSAGSELLSSLTTEFDSMLDGMQSPVARAGMKAAFSATPKQLARASVQSATEPKRAR